MNDNTLSELVAAPKSVEDVENLIKRLYTPGAFRVIAAIDDHLKRLQLSDGGWQLADALLGSQDVNARFFGALTFQVKLNNDGSRLDAATAQDVLLRLISWTIQAARPEEGQVIRKKLCATLGTYYLRSPAPWRRPLLQLATSFQQGNAIPDDQLPDVEDAMNQLLPLLDEHQLAIMLWLSGTLAADVVKVDGSTPAGGQLHLQMEAIVVNASTTMQHALGRAASIQSPKFTAEILACYLNWVNYAQPIWPSKPESLEYLRRLVTDLVPLLTDADDQSEALDVFRDILENYTSFFQPQHMEMLAQVIHQHIAPRMLQGLSQCEPEVLPVVQMVCAYGTANVQRIIEQPDDHLGSRGIVQLILAILQSPGFPGDEDEVSVHSIEFWNTFIEHVNDKMYEKSPDEPDYPWVQHEKAICMELSNLLWAKLRTPPPEVAQEWSDAEQDGFKEFRTDASDLMLSLFLHLGRTLLQQLVDLALSALQSKNWHDLEAALFCINNLADNVQEDQASQPLLAQIFGSSLFRDIADFSQPLPLQTRRTAVDTLGMHGHYIERHAEYLPDALRFLFASLEHPGLYGYAAKSIASLCSACRSSLTGELDGFIAQYNRFASSPNSDPYATEKVIGAIAAIIQAVTPESAKARPLSALLDVVDGSIEHARQLARGSDHDGAHAAGVSALSYLAIIGKNLQIPDDVPINLYDEEVSSQDQNSYWQGQEGQAIQHRILSSCFGVLQLLPLSGETVEGVCQVLRSGFAETESGPFVFPPNTSINLLEQCSQDTPQIEAVLSMIGTLLVQYSRRDSRRIDAEVTRIYTKIASFTHALGEPRQDPAVAQSCIDVLVRMVSRYPNVLLGTGSSGEHVKPLLDYCIKAIDGPDLMPKRAAADFWARLVDTQPAEEEVKARLHAVLATYGPILVQALMNQMTGGAQRSELQQLGEPLRDLLKRQSQARSWMEGALWGGALTSSVDAKVSEAVMRRFVQSAFSVRNDGKKFREVVNNFYAACRGTMASFG